MLRNLVTYAPDELFPFAVYVDKLGDEIHIIVVTTHSDETSPLKVVIDVDGKLVNV